MTWQFHCWAYIHNKNTKSKGTLTPMFTVFVVVVLSLSCVCLLVTPWLQHARLPCPSLSLRVCSNKCILSQGWHPTISSSALNLSQHQGLFQKVVSSYQVAKVLELQL